jgi:AraC family transcriptional regulator, regulatory protein of adaptative response / DNA-3-methyladenine glycosylase II
MLSDHQCYAAIVSQDRRFDGLFFVGVTSTGIYCRSICTAKTPKRENCRFFPSAAAAEQVGFRPCLRCRPELAPGQAKIDAVSRLAAAAASAIESGFLTTQSVTELAAFLGVSDRHLRRVINLEFGVSPIQLAQTQRLLLAKRLLTESHLPIADVAFASGFSSVRRLNALFQKRYQLNPAQLRKTQAIPQQGLCCEIAYRPPLDWSGLLAFLQGRAIAGVELIDEQCYQRTVQLGHHRGWLKVSLIPSQAKLQVNLSASLVAVILPLLTRVKSLFDLAATPQAIEQCLGEVIAPFPGLRVPGAFDGFEVAVRAILGQQVTVKAATTLMGRFVQTFGSPVTTPIPSLTHLTPTPLQIAELAPTEIAELGIIKSRAISICTLAQALAEGRIQLAPYADITSTIAQLKALPGISDWTAQYIAMRVLADPDAFPYGDLVLRKALGADTPTQVLQTAETWRPWRAYAAMSIWKSWNQTHA